jgi:hypothetical protein
MNRYLSCIISSFLFVVLCSNSCLSDDYDFRKVRWGMSIQQVKESEPLEISHTEENLLGYKTKVIDKNVFLIYFFVEDKLVRATYGLADEHSNKNDFINDYNDFKNILIKKYGKPVKENTYWRNNLYKSDTSQWGFAISLAHLSYFAQWESEETQIISSLYGDNYAIKCGVEYSSKKLKPFVEKYKDKKGLENF